MTKENKPSNLLWSESKVSYADRCMALKQKGLVVWFTGLSASGKSTIAVEVEKRLFDLGHCVYRLDGDNIRQGLNNDLGFSEGDRIENIRRIAEVAALFKDAGLIVLTCFISPHRHMRAFAREKAGAGSFIEVYVKADVKTCAERDPKGLYAKALKGQIEEFTGVSSPYEEPLEPELILDTEALSLDQCVQQAVDMILQNVRISS